MSKEIKEKYLDIEYNSMDSSIPKGEIHVYKPLSQYNSGGTRYLTTYDFIQKEMNHMLGDILTIIDASVPEGKQNKSIKDLIKNVYTNEYCRLTYELFSEEWMEKATDFSERDPNEAFEVSTDEALGIK